MKTYAERLADGTWQPNPTGNGGFRDHPEHAFKPSSAHMAQLAKRSATASARTRKAHADARFEVRTRRALFDIRADLSPADVAALVHLVRRAYEAGDLRGYQRGRYQRQIAIGA